MDRAGWQQLADLRLIDAEALVAAGRWAAAYYLVGSAVECGLKSCVLARLGREPEIIFQPNQKKFSGSCWTHDIEALVELAGIKEIRRFDTTANLNLNEYWGYVKDWSEQARYALRPDADAEPLAKKPFLAASDPVDGVLPWIKNHW